MPLRDRIDRLGVGAGGRNRTGTPVKARDFGSDITGRPASDESPPKSRCALEHATYPECRDSRFDGAGRRCQPPRRYWVSEKVGAVSTAVSPVVVSKRSTKSNSSSSSETFRRRYSSRSRRVMRSAGWAGRVPGSGRPTGFLTPRQRRRSPAPVRAARRPGPTRSVAPSPAPRAASSARGSPATGTPAPGGRTDGSGPRGCTTG